MSDIYDIIARQGTTLNINLSLTNEYNAPIILSGYGVRGKVRNRYSDTGSIFDLSPTITSNELGTINISGSATGIASLPVGQMIYDIEAYDGEFVTKPIRGKFNVEPESSF